MGCDLSRPPYTEYCGLFPLDSCGSCGSVDRRVLGLNLGDTDGKAVDGDAKRRRLVVEGECKTCLTNWQVPVEWETGCKCVVPVRRLTQRTDKYLGVCDACGVGYQGWNRFSTSPAGVLLDRDPPLRQRSASA